MFNSWSFMFKIKKGSSLFRGPAPHLFRARDLPFAPSGDILRSVLRISLRRPENFSALGAELLCLQTQTKELD